MTPRNVKRLFYFFLLMIFSVLPLALIGIGVLIYTIFKQINDYF